MNNTGENLFYFTEHSHVAAEQTGYSDYSYWRSVIQTFLKKKGAVFMMVLFVAIVVFSYIALDIGKYDYSDLKVDTTLAFINPNKDYWFGTDNLGRDYWCQVWYAAQISIKLAIIVVLGECVIGVTVGLGVYP